MQLPTILLVDDNPANLLLLEKYLQNTASPDYHTYNIVTACHGKEALALLEKSPNKFDAVLLDIMMPGMDGLELLNHIKSNAALKTLPIILQSALSSKKDIAAGLKAGALYYLTKPIDEKHMLPIVKTAVNDSLNYKYLKEKSNKIVQTVALTKKWCLGLKTIEDTEITASTLGKMYPDYKMATVGLSELMVNAVEHGNLAISYDEKTTLVDEDRWKTEVDRRLALPENSDKQVSVKLEILDSEIRATIKDQGKGFDWRSYMKVDIGRVMDNHGRGIVMARMSFDSIEYSGTGSTVMAVKKL